MRKVRQAMLKDDLQDADFAPVPVVLERETAARAKVLQALESTISLKFNETPLREVAGFLAETCSIVVVLDRRALDDVGLGTDTPVTFSSTACRCAAHCG